MKTNKAKPWSAFQQYVSHYQNENPGTSIDIKALSSHMRNKKWFGIVTRLIAGGGICFFISLAACLFTLQPSEHSLRATLLGTLFYISLFGSVALIPAWFWTIIKAWDCDELDRLPDRYLADRKAYRKFFYKELPEKLSLEELESLQQEIANHAQITSLARCVVLFQRAKGRTEAAQKMKQRYDEILTAVQRLLGVPYSTHGTLLAQAKAGVEERLGRDPGLPTDKELGL